MVDFRKVDKAEATRIMGLVEGHFMDVKRIEISPARLSESISAFANAAGGELFVGVGENLDKTKRFWLGFKLQEDANGLFQVINKMTPLGNHYSATWLQCDDVDYPGFVLHLVIPKTTQVVYSSDGSAFVRSNAQNLRVTGNEALHRLRLDKGVASFEDESVNVAPDVITNSVIGNGFILNVIPSSEPDEWMKKQNLISAARQPIVAGVLLFADEPQAALPKRSAIKIYRYQTKAAEGSRDQLVGNPITIEGPLYDQISKAVSKTKELIEGIKSLTTKGLENVVYPDETLHEIITNAVLHRDYSIASDVHVRIYDNRIEVESPGRLAGHVTTKNYLKEQFARNPRIVRLINKFPNPPNKDVGEGLNTAFEAMRKLRLKEPEIVEGDHSVIVHIRHTSLASPQDAMMKYLEDHEEITNRIGRDLTGITSENVMKDVFISLAKRSLLERVPDKRGNASAWRKYTGYWKEQTEDMLTALDEPQDEPNAD
jgi:ATP-dependent DNA helicase RecG